MQAAQAMQQYADWAPKEFDDAAQPSGEQQGQAQQEQAAGPSQAWPDSSNQVLYALLLQKTLQHVE